MYEHIPLSVLNDEATLVVPTSSGSKSISLTNIRVQTCSKVREYSSTAVKNISELTMYYDCENSSPSEVDFAAGMAVIYDGVRYEIISAEVFKTESQPHHIKITARIV